MIAACGAAPPTEPPPAVDAPASPEDPQVRRCTVTADEVACDYDTLALAQRDVHFALPAGEAPDAGWPVVIAYQGSFVSAERGFAAREGDTFGAYHASLTIANLLDAGFAVLAPEALADGSTAWQTNLPPTNVLWEGSADDRLVLALLAAIDDGMFGPLDGTRLHAMGISSGGFMTSRMAVSYPGRFRALAILAGSYATCSTICILPPQLPIDHPPTMFLIGAGDPAVPLSTVTAYHDQLVDEGHEAVVVVNPEAGHEWIPEAATGIRAWFEAP